MSGIINAWLLVPNLSALIESKYGRLLLAKIALFFLMLSFAAINRLRLTPGFLAVSDPAIGMPVLKQIQRNTVIEALGGAGIILIVAVLGILSPID